MTNEHNLAYQPISSKLPAEIHGKILDDLRTNLNRDVRDQSKITIEKVQNGYIVTDYQERVWILTALADIERLYREIVGE